MKHIALDLELEQPYTNNDTPDSELDEEKIIQVGWVVFECKPFKLLTKRIYHVNLDIKLSSFIKKLTRIKDENLKEGISLKDIYDKLVYDMKDYETIRVVKQWGSGDMKQLRKELPDDIKWEFGRQGCNVKHFYQSYAEAVGLNRSGGLSKSMGKCGLTWQGGGAKHNAMNDALNTAYFYNYLMNQFKELR